MIETISTIEDVEVFAKQLVAEGVSFHPDDDFFDYVNHKTKEPYYTKEEAEFRNKLMDQCFAVCKKEGKDIYDIMLEVTLRETGMDKYIPLPSRVGSDL